MVNGILELGAFGDAGLTGADLLSRLAWLRDVVRPRLERFLGYYRNPVTELAATLPCAANASFAVRPFRQFQELGLPARITGFRRGADGSSAATGPMDHQRKEVVIENDIGWRIDTMVDFAARRAPAITSTARDENLRRVLTGLINDLLRSCGGTTVEFLQELVLRGAVEGSAWVQIRPSAELLGRLSGGGNLGGDAGAENGDGAGVAMPDQDNASEAISAERWLMLEVVEAARLCPLPGYAVILRDCAAAAAVGGGRGTGILDRVRAWFLGPAVGPDAGEFSFDIFGANLWQRYESGALVDEGANGLGVVPFVRYENAKDPAAGTRVGPAGSGVVDVGMGDVEPLVGMQDELNTRLSDRAFRVTMSSFRMYLGRGIEDFIKRPIGPGQMWATNNPEATIESFGGDATTPSETAHIEEVREAMDKISGVPPVAAGLLEGKIGNLTSAVALQITLIALLARTERKRAALERTMSAVVGMALSILDRAGILRTAVEDRGMDVNWPTPLPEGDMERLQEAQVKIALGIPREVVLEELGYGELGLK